LQSYFRLNAKGAGQFEHTLIIVDEGADLHFIEGCSAPKYNVANLHAGCVELYVGKNARLRYSTIENWSKNMYNLNTKRAVVEEGGRIEWVSGSFGSHVSYLYPMSILEAVSCGCYAYLSDIPSHREFLSNNPSCGDLIENISENNILENRNTNFYNLSAQKMADEYTKIYLGEK